MTPKTLQDYGAPKVDAEPVENPTAEAAADEYNELTEDVAQMTRTADRFIVSFTTTATAAPTTATVTYNWSIFGQGDSYKPTVAKTATGTYTLTYAASYVNGLQETETTSHGPAKGQVAGSAFGQVQCTTTSATVITVHILDAAGSLTDISGGKTVTVWIR